MTKVSPIKDFHQKYSEVIIELLKIPMHALCLNSNDYVPFEFAGDTKVVRYKRDKEAVLNLLKREPEFAIFCIEHEIPVDMLQSFKGGNLYSYNMNIKAIRGQRRA